MGLLSLRDADSRRMESRHVTWSRRAHTDEIDGDLSFSPHGRVIRIEILWKRVAWITQGTEPQQRETAAGPKTLYNMLAAKTSVRSCEGACEARCG